MNTSGWTIRKAFENIATSMPCAGELATCQAPAAWCCESPRDPRTWMYVCLEHKDNFERTGHFFGLHERTEPPPGTP